MKKSVFLGALAGATLVGGIASAVIALLYADAFMLTFIGMTTGDWL